MRIIKEGAVPPKTESLYRATCSRCGTEFEFTKSDTEISPDPLAGDVAVTCPLPACGHSSMLFLGFFYHGARVMA
jgi:DNA-directed RNA polymerase subunit RPC12/RpoP